MPITQISGPAVAIDGGVALGAPLTIGTNDAQPLIFETNGTERARFTATGELIVVGSITTINSTVVDIADRVFTVNKSAGANDPVPSLMSGLSVYRGAVMGVARDKACVIWDEPNSRWNFALNTGADELTIGADQTVKLASLLASGNIRQLTNNSTISGRNAAGMADIEIARVNTSDEVSIAAGGANVVFGGGNIQSVGAGNGSVTFHANGNGHAQLHSKNGTLSLETQGGAIEIGTTNHSRTISIGTGDAMTQQTVVVGSTHNGSLLTLDSGTGAINIGASASARTVNIATGAAQQAVTIGSTASGSTLTLDAASAVSIATSNTARTVNIATGAAAQAVQIGSSTGASSMTLNVGSSPFSVTTASNSSVSVTYGTNGTMFQQQAGTGGTPFGFNTTFGAHTGLSNTEFNDVNFNFARTVQFSGGGSTIPTQRAMRLQAPTYSAASAQSVNRAATIEISGAPTAGTNVTFSTNSYLGPGTWALNVQSGATRLGGDTFVSGNFSSVGTFPLSVYTTGGSDGWRSYAAGGGAFVFLGAGTITTFTYTVNLSPDTDATAAQQSLGTSAKRWNSSWVATGNTKTHAAFTGSQEVVQTGAVQTTDAATTTAFTSPALLDNSATWVEIQLSARDTGGANRGMAVRRALISRQAAGAATIVGAVADEYTNMPAAWGGGVALTQCTIDTTGSTFRVRVQGVAGSTINWACTVRYQTVSGNA